MYYKCVVLLFFINYLRLNYLRLTSYINHTLLILTSYINHTLLILTSYLPKTYIRPVLTSLLTAIFIILSTWLYLVLGCIIIITSSDDIQPSTLLSVQLPGGFTQNWADKNCCAARSSYISSMHALSMHYNYVECFVAIFQLNRRQYHGTINTVQQHVK